MLKKDEHKKTQWPRLEKCKHDNSFVSDRHMPCCGYHKIECYRSTSHFLLNADANEMQLLTDLTRSSLTRLQNKTDLYKPKD